MADLLINIDVPDLEQAILFYQRAAGLQLGRRLFSGTVAEMLGAASPIYLLLKESGTSPSAHTSQQRQYDRHWTPVHLDFLVQDIEAAVDKAQTAGGLLEGQVQTFGWGRQALMCDPFGNGFCLVQFSGRGYEEAS
jgi:predicted enzyme related to lactoylglutathione lyase